MEMDKTTAALEAINNETIDLVVKNLLYILLDYLHIIVKCIWLVSICRLVPQENIPIEEVLDKLKCTEEGLTSDEVERRLQVFGHNKLEEKRVLIYVIRCMDISIRYFG